ncbi:MAG: hypothetical protein WAX77_00285 [Methylococcaceae bacterium]
MKQEFFFPIYQKIENEFKELSFSINIDKKQLTVYSIKIADLILRTVAECENISKALCKKNGIKFKDKKGKVRSFVNFSEYINELNKIFSLDEKLVNFIYSNAANDTFDCKHQPFNKKFITSNKKESWDWYHAYNLIKHDRVLNYKQANLGNLINGMAALFLLNVYYKNEIFYNKHSDELDSIISSIESFSDIFNLDYAIVIPDEKQYDNYNNSFFNIKHYFEIARPFSTYLIEYNKEIKTSSDKGADVMDKIESSLCIQNTDGTFVKKYEHYEFKNHTSIVALVAYIDKAK